MHHCKTRVVPMTGDGENDEEVYKLAGELAKNGGLQALLQRVQAIRDMVTGRTLMTMALKLLGYCVKVRTNRLELVRPEMNTVSTMLSALNLVRPLLSMCETKSRLTVDFKTFLSTEVVGVSFNA